jgi:hypothetical protein
MDKARIALAIIWGLAMGEKLREKGKKRRTETAPG